MLNQGKITDKLTILLIYHPQLGKQLAYFLRNKLRINNNLPISSLANNGTSIT